MSLLFLGDLFYGYSSISEDIYMISKYIKSINANTILNLEGPLALNTDNRIKKRGEHLCQNYCVVEVLKLLNVKGVSLCNNHMFDFGIDGVEDTIKILEENGIAYCGIGFRNGIIKESMIIEDDGNLVEIFAATDPYEESVCIQDNCPGCVTISSLLNQDTINSNRKKIAFLHTGFEYNTLPTIRTVKECRKLIDDGYDMVVCSHPHLIQPYEIYRDKYIFYSIGNFYFSNFTDEFLDKKIKNKKEGYCCDGLGILICDNRVEIIGIDYQIKDKNYLVRKNKSVPNLNTNVNSLNYRYEYLANRNNHNFMLTGNFMMDSIKMKILSIMYSVYRKIRRLDG